MVRGQGDKETRGEGNGSVSVVIPALNEAASIAQAVRRAWELGPREVIVVDGGSTDGTLDVARSCRCVALASPRGRGVQQNAGAAAASGDVLLFLHADTWLDPGAIEQIAAALASDRVCGGSFRQRIEAPGFLYRLLECGNALRARWGRPYGDQGIFLRRDVFFRGGGFPEAALMEDVLLVRKIRRCGRLVLLPGRIHVSPRRWQKHGIVRQTLRNWRLLTALGWGADPERLAEHYEPHS
ncbi:MAG: TIGR04283 family arsenosugar biosynthesis glycosyltransferase [Planctomycetia bacterium]|nr:TIGR04283 family arsenosugar biosynthesis glycosyltransferase [Planctomycetia bacterium]